ncbi:Cdc37 [Metarhizium album ARSEF 1941]|uniref:Cdc37 n=1 Tax=Metarhizium album (strain ARSEF 1941) TaxID=1081103 RepID=A0A0B2WFQ4_METAS|nr:Cdc37 [Metarhizium album ARSEF 1941]KHN94746.1 Cdc37 [Metarhizium album ARSEF 1941]
MEAFNIALDEGDEAETWQYVHQALLLQYCRMPGRDGVTVFFSRMALPQHRAQEIFGGRSVEQIHIQALEPGSAIQIRIPDLDSNDEDEREARAIFDSFSPEIKAALESASLEEVNSVLGTMEVAEAENLVSLPWRGWLLERREGDYRRHDGRRKKQLKEMEEAAMGNANVEPETAAQAGAGVSGQACHEKIDGNIS